ncbi:phosphopantetheine-binding protein [Paenibacillus sp.]|uniref:phosphopantetheine-binding protein n=1 Tax=Paenibacillus sp. TaxID=58172 RepID=UPI00282DA935|nr:phosphopantetheine-binding protein [Paenibacillus sp.]MDR0267477.1 phosphopantetheine-binding protein [Paenibacillus sp.]
MENIRERIIKTLITASEGQLNEEKIAEVDDNVEGLLLDSLTIIKWIVLLEEEFEIEIELEKVVIESPVLWSFDLLTNFLRTEIQAVHG